MRTKCRVSGNDLIKVADLGNLYLSTFVRERDESLPRGELRLGIGRDSGLIQLMDSADRDLMYRQYWYLSGTNATMTRQLRDVVSTVPHWIRLKDGDHVLDIGCNDGTLLKQYDPAIKITKVGIDPARNIAEIGRQHCDLHANDYFSKDAYLDLTRGKKAKVITSIAMFYDLEDPNQFVDDIKACLDDDGIWIIQMSYTPLMFVQNAFDNIIHEHLEYYTLSSTSFLLDRHDLKILDVDFNDTNSGSFRVIVGKKGRPFSDAALFYTDIGRYRFEATLSYEKQNGIDTPEACQKFMERVDTQKARALDLLDTLRLQKKRVFGYGASTKGNTLLQYYGIDSTLISAIAERQEQKWGLLTVGTWIPIVSEAQMRLEKPDYLFILPWHFLNEFHYRESEFLKGGGKFIVPLPELRVIGD